MTDSLASVGEVDPSRLAPEVVVRRYAEHLLRMLPQLDDVVRLAAEVAGTSAAAVNLVHSHGQEAIAVWGVAATVCAAEDSMCSRTIAEGGPILCTDARTDDRFADNPWVTGALGRVRFYAAMPLLSEDGVAFGTLCVFDERVHTIDDVARARLRALADHVQELLRVAAQGAELHTAVGDLAERHSELIRSNELLTQFAGQVAHDLKGPMTTVRMTVGMLGQLEAVRADPLADTLLDRVEGAGRRMDALINGFLALATLEAAIERTPVDLAAMLEEVLADLSASLVHHELRLGTLPVVVGDPVQLRALLQNLVANAAKFSRTCDERVIRVSGGGSGDEWWCEVADSGPGVPPELREVVFEPLVRGDTTTEGLGLGLAACRRIATNHDATVAIGDAPEGGALLRVERTGARRQAT